MTIAAYEDLRSSRRLALERDGRWRHAWSGALIALMASGLPGAAASQTANEAAPAETWMASDPVLEDRETVIGGEPNTRAPSWFKTANLRIRASKPAARRDLPDGAVTVRITHRRVSTSIMRAGTEQDVQTYAYDEAGMRQLADRIAAHLQTAPGALVVIDWLNVAKRYQLAMTVRTLNAISIEPGLAAWYNWPRGWMNAPP